MLSGLQIVLQVKRFEVHKSRVNDISMDESGEFLASCSDDGSAAVRYPPLFADLCITDILLWHVYLKLL